MGGCCLVMDYKEGLNKLIEEANGKVRKDATLDNFIRFIKESEYYVLWGASKGGKETKRMIEHYGGEVVAFIDSDRKKWGTKFQNLEVFSPEKVPEFVKERVKIVVSTMYDRAVSSLLEKVFGLRLLKEYSISPITSWHNLERLGDFGGVNFLNLLRENIDKVENIFSFFRDESSKKTYFEILRSRIYHFNFEVQVNYPISNFHHYFHPEVRPRNGDIIVDGGAFVGDTISDVVEGKIKFRKIYAFEPDKDNLSVLKRKFRSNGNIVLIPKGLWEDNRKLFFVSSENTMNSFIVENLEEVKGKKVSYIEVVSIDEFFKSEGDFPDFIKMDIEGSEIEALKGARDTISIQAPRLAISIYHKASDLWEIPLLIKNLNPKYKLFIGHHSFFWAESVVYAKQEER